MIKYIKHFVFIYMALLVLHSIVNLIITVHKYIYPEDPSNAVMINVFIAIAYLFVVKEWRAIIFK